MFTALLVLLSFCTRSLSRSLRGLRIAVLLVCAGLGLPGLEATTPTTVTTATPPLPSTSSTAALPQITFAQLARSQIPAAQASPPAPDAASATTTTANAAVAAQVILPPELQSLVGATVEITGYMLPLAAGRFSCPRFLLMANTSGCCFGNMPQPNEFILVNSPAGVPLTLDQPTTVRGRLVLAPQFEQGVCTLLVVLEDGQSAPGLATP